MSKKKSGSNGILLMGVLGLAAVGGLAYARQSGALDFSGMVGGNAATDDTTAPTGGLPGFGVNAGSYYGTRPSPGLVAGPTAPGYYGQTMAERYASQYATVVTAGGGGTRTPTYSTDPSPTVTGAQVGFSVGTAGLYR